MSEFRERLIAARTRLNLTKTQMADILMTRVETYRKWENGRARVPPTAIVAAEIICTHPIGKRISRHPDFGSAYIAQILARAKKIYP